MERIELKDYSLSFNSLTTRSKTNKIVIHHTGNPTDDDLSAQQIHKSHLAQGWAGIGYHYVVRKNGTIEVGRPHWTVGSHAYGHNSSTIGIHLCGNFQIGHPTPAQIEAVAMLLANVCTSYGLSIDANHVVGHRDLMATACPGVNLYNILDTIRGKAVFYQNQNKNSTTPTKEQASSKAVGSKYFKENELRCHGTGCCNGGAENVSPKLLELLDQLRTNVGGPISATSVYRCLTHNKRVGGVSNSQHVQGTAADLAVPSYLTFGQFKWYIEQLPFDGIGLYKSDNFIHVDVRNGGVGSKIYWEG